MLLSWELCGVDSARPMIENSWKRLRAVPKRARYARPTYDDTDMARPCNCRGNAHRLAQNPERSDGPTAQPETRGDHSRPLATLGVLGHTQSHGLLT